MPPRTTYRKKKRTYRRRPIRRRPVKKKTVFRPQRGLRPAIHPFKRILPHQVVTLNQTAAEGGPGAGWDTTYQSLGYIGRLFIFRLGDLNFHSEFTNLFAYYKLNAVNLKIYPAASLQVAARNNSAVIVTTLPARAGNNIVIAPEHLECVQARKDRMLLNNQGKPFSVYMKLNQLSMVYQAPSGVPPTATSYGLVKPRYISTQEINTEHYGMWVYFRSVNHTAFDTIQVRIEPTLYLSMKQVE